MERIQRREQIREQAARREAQIEEDAANNLREINEQLTENMTEKEQTAQEPGENLPLLRAQKAAAREKQIMEERKQRRSIGEKRHHER